MTSGNATRKTAAWLIVGAVAVIVWLVALNVPGIWFNGSITQVRELCGTGLIRSASCPSASHISTVLAFIGWAGIGVIVVSGIRLLIAISRPPAPEPPVTGAAPSPPPARRGNGHVHRWVVRRDGSEACGMCLVARPPASGAATDAAGNDLHVERNLPA